ncbi:TetR/AcrR family transcriptional regulator [Phaeobacter sp. 22II1-1F12B]|uniref:TetR/AcrR family transcriptional regulator n=1 Tax=Phaeobacter sp. 22II1-1F12B TaxID=1317111 RepID=UPI000B528159|nr:TetR/AcrR family transcriptional regulator [Phaeobacter sp. 22II1-1F12B]OWU69565.1 TetR family transcriptional regulator [Phaeobacter sp. 22II1-1F12B]
MRQPTSDKENFRNTDGRIARGEATRQRVLDAAERCFASDGFEAVTIRQIARTAEVTLGVVSFHGGSKEDLFKTVLARRVATLDDLRKAALAEVRARGEMTIRDVVDAYLTPYLDIASRGDPQWRAYAQFIARVASNDDYFPEVRELYDPTARIFIAEFQRLRPGASAEALATVLTLTVASMLSIVASRARIAGLSGSDAIDQPMGYRAMLIDFCTGGIEMVLPSD